MATLNPYLHFKGNCREAMMFYRDSLGAQLDMQTIGESPMAAGVPKETHNNVLHSTLEKDGFVLMASDMTDPETAVQVNTVTLCRVCNSKEEIESLYAKLSAGGKIGHPLKA